MVAGAPLNWPKKGRDSTSRPNDYSEPGYYGFLIRPFAIES